MLLIFLKEALRDPFKKLATHLNPYLPQNVVIFGVAGHIE